MKLSIPSILTLMVVYVSGIEYIYSLSPTVAVVIVAIQLFLLNLDNIEC